MGAVGGKIFFRDVIRVAFTGWIASATALVCPAAASSVHEPPSVVQPPEVPATPSDPRALYKALNDLRPDAEHVYTVQELNLRRDVINLRLTSGKLAFLTALDGRITGAVFTGHGHIYATPHDRGERRSLAQFLNVPILDLTFSRAYFRFTDDTAAEIKRQLISDGASASRDGEFTDSWEAVAANLNAWHSLRIMFDWLSTDPLPYFYAGIESDSVGPFDVLVDNRRNEGVLLGQPRFANGVRFYDTWASFRAQDAPQTTPESFAPLGYRVETTIADDLSLDGVTTMRLRTVRSGERLVPLELSRNLAVESVKLADGRPLVYFQNEYLSRRDLLRQGNDSLIVALPASSKPGEEFEVQVKYRGSVITEAGNGVEFVGERGTWYAHVGGGDHFVLFDLTFRWPKRLSLVATGRRVESREEGDMHVGRWQSVVPFAVAGFNLGEYKSESIGSENPRIQLYANQQWEKYILDLLQKNSSKTSGVVPPNLKSPRDPARFAVPDPLPPSPAAVLKRLGGQISDSIGFLENFNGAFPFDHLDVSQIPGSFGQGWPGLLYLSTLVFLTHETQMQAGIAQRTQQEASELMPIHEVAHQWWGNVVGAVSYRDAWIEEGMANYLALLYADSKKPAEHLLTSWLEHYRAELSLPLPGSKEIVGDAGPLTFGSRLASSKAPRAYEAVTYGKGTWVMHMLREMLREPGSRDPDRKFRELLHTILTEHRFQTLSTAQFQRAVEQMMTPEMDLEATHSMDWFYDEWVRGTGIPGYEVEFQVRPHGQEFLVTGKLTQEGVDDIFTAAVPLYAGKSGGKLERLGVVVTTGTETRFHFICKTRPVQVQIDPYLTTLHRMD
jgi:hypothetical protein